MIVYIVLIIGRAEATSSLTVSMLGDCRTRFKALVSKTSLWYSICRLTRGILEKGAISNLKYDFGAKYP